MSSARRWILGALALPLLYLPLRAAETPTAASPESATPAAPADNASDKPADVKLEPVPAATADPGERLSLDNNISFPVDI